MIMQAPPSRYRVIERKGRLEVIDTWAGHRPATAHVPLEPAAAEPPAVAAATAAPDPLVERWPDFAPEPVAPASALDPAPDPVPPLASQQMLASPTGFLHSVAATVCGDQRDIDGRLMLNTKRWFDQKAPRRIALDPDGERQIGLTVLILFAGAIGFALIALTSSWFAIPILLIAFWVGRRVPAMVTPMLDQIAARR